MNKNDLLELTPKEERLIKGVTNRHNLNFEEFEVKKTKNNFINENKVTFTRTLVVGIILTIIGYFFGIYLVDVLGFKYAVVEIILIIIIFILRYFAHKYWVFK